MGMTTIEHSTLWLHPSDSFSTSLRTSNSTEPAPVVSVKAATSAAGKGGVDRGLGGHVRAVARLEDLPGGGDERA